MTTGILAKGFDHSQLLCEETIDGAVYKTYLKKVLLQMRPWIWSENTTHTLWTIKKVRCISAGTLPKLVDALVTQNGELDTNYTNMFLCMYRTCATVDEVLNLILDRIKYWKSTEWRNRPQASLYRKAYIMVLSIWLKTYPEDFRQIPDYGILRRLSLHADEYAIGSYIKIKADALIRRFQTEFRQHWTEDIAVLSDASLSSHGKMEPTRKILLRMSPTMVAEQLTYRDAELLLNLVPHHCLGFYWVHEWEPVDLPTVQAVISQYNYVSNIVISSILKAGQKPKHRVKVLEHWILVAQILRNLNSFSSLHAVIRALKSFPIHRLVKTWAAVSKRVDADYEDITHMFFHANNVFNSRSILMEEAMSGFYTTSKGKLVRKYPKEVTMQGTIPYLDLFLSDLIHLDYSLPNKTAAGLINFDKRLQEFDILTQLMWLKKSATLYEFQKNPSFWKWFFSVCIYSEAESSNMSWSLEP